MKAEQPYVKKIITILKFILLPATFGFIFYKLFYAYQLHHLIAETKIKWNSWNVLLLFGVLTLMVFNWLLEAVKWQLLVKKHEKFTFGQAMSGVLSGVALNMITPNQLGDFAGRLIHLKKTDKIRGTLVTVIGHTAQVIMTAAFGLYAFIWFLLQKHMISTGTGSLLYAVLFILVIACLAAYLHISWISKLKIKRISAYLDVFRLYTRSELVQVLMISFLRYSIFLCQYYFLLLLFGVDVGFVQGMGCIIATICAQSFVPGFILVEIGMRGASALWFFGMFTPQVTPVLLTAYTLWIINLMIPGLAGLLIILRWKGDK